ncbi:MAG: cysteine--tRNA ligase [Candidatus Schekmanbacteria bacterium RBG_16_38_11]|uniref:Cysteine--tRNA ligase n=1 Tax=Candidatus Schekmanbacteria bacterium RBG_16_38_11 TaxID=1817880 RepID=A0A1F7RS53_9BACT|nr:MAG: cysteine--tRNA ligase [Candidatus Schekmanbacteria bacterium RBG_16_38_11]
MALSIYNSMTGKKEAFVPRTERKVGMYACGVTVYDVCHIGHARSAIVFDVIKRYLEQKGYEVTFIKNFTDIDDKIINKAKAEGKTCEEISGKYIKKYYEDMHALGVSDATIEPRATQYIEEITGMVKGLIEKGYAYEIDGDVYFSVKKFNGYGKLSKKNIDELESGARVEVDERKKDPLDFALWKSSKPGEPFWDSPWGKGRPGWHIECSVMSMKHLGECFDIHGGGKDLIFPHHENEIAQSEAFSGKPLAKYWVHNGFVNINSQKMSKSLGNFFTIKDVLKLYEPEVIRLFLLLTHYRSPLDFSEDNLKSALSGLERVYTTLKRIKEIKEEFRVKAGQTLKESGEKQKKSFLEEVSSFKASFEEAMDDDFNTAKALGKVFELIKEINIFINEKRDFSKDDLDSLTEAGNLIKKNGKILGLFQDDPQEWFKKSWVESPVSEEISEEEVNRLIEERNSARKKKDWQAADRIRKELLEKNIILEDTPSGTKWKRVK